MSGFLTTFFLISTVLLATKGVEISGYDQYTIITHGNALPIESNELLEHVRNQTSHTVQNLASQSVLGKWLNI